MENQKEKQGEQNMEAGRIRMVAARNRLFLGGRGYAKF